MCFFFFFFPALKKYHVSYHVKFVALSGRLVWSIHHASSNRLLKPFYSLKQAVSARLLQHPDRSFAIEVTLDLIKGAEFFNRKPPVHFHMQEEYIESTQGSLGLEIEGKELVLKPEDGRFDIKAYMNHRSYPIDLARQDDGNTVVKFLLSGAKTSSTFELNPLFFENWYKYQDEFVVNGANIDLIQVFCVRQPPLRAFASMRVRESKLTD